MNDFSYDIQPLCSTVPLPREWNSGTNLQSAEQLTEQRRNMFSQSLSKQDVGAEQRVEQPWNSGIKICSITN